MYLTELGIYLFGSKSKKKIQKEGLLKELKQRQFFEKPSAKKARKKAEGIKRYQRNLKKKQERLGY